MTVRKVTFKKRQITLLIGSRLAEVVLDSELFKAVPFIKDEITDMQDEYLDRELTNQRVINGTRVETVTFRAVSRIDNDLASLMRLSVLNRKIDLEMDICKSCVFSVCDETISKTLKTLNGVRWNETNVANHSGEPFEDLRRASCIKSAFPHSWLSGYVNCKAKDGHHKLMDGIPEQCPFILEHVVSHGAH